MNVFNEKIVQYLREGLDTALVNKSVTERLNLGYRGGLKPKFLDYETVKIPLINLGGLGEYRRGNESLPAPGFVNFTGSSPNGDGYYKSSSGVEWETFKLQFERSASISIDGLSNLELGNVVVANLGGEFYRTQVVPELDATRLSYIASRGNVSLGNIEVKDLTADGGVNDVLVSFDKAFAWLKNHGVETENQVIFVSTRTYELIQRSTRIVRYLNVADETNGGISTKVYTYNGRVIVPVEDRRFFTNVKLFNGGYSPSVFSESINFLIVDPENIWEITNIINLQLFAPENVQDFYGAKFVFLIKHGIFVPKNKAPGVYVSLATQLSSFAGSSLLLETVPGQQASSFQIPSSESIWLNPTSTLYNAIKFDTQAHNSGDVLSGGLVVTPGQDTVVDANITKGYFYAVDDRNVIVAHTPEEVTLAKKAPEAPAGKA